MPDPINPAHYISPDGTMETIDVIEAFTSDLQGIEAVCTANALKYMRAALKSAPTSPKVHNRLAEIYEKIGLDDKAEEHRALARRHTRKKNR